MNQQLCSLRDLSSSPKYKSKQKQCQAVTTTTVITMTKHFGKICRIYRECRQDLIQQQHSTFPGWISCADPKNSLPHRSHNYAQASPWVFLSEFIDARQLPQAGFQRYMLSVVFKYTCRFSNAHAFSEASSQCFPKISLNSFTHQYPPQGRKKNVWSGTYLCTFCIWQSDMERADLRSDRIHR